MLANQLITSLAPEQHRCTADRFKVASHLRNILPANWVVQQWDTGCGVGYLIVYGPDVIHPVHGRKASGRGWRLREAKQIASTCLALGNPFGAIIDEACGVVV